MKSTAVLLLLTFATCVLQAQTLTLSRADYTDRCQAIWAGQVIAVYVGFPFEHKTASAKPVYQFPRKYTHAIVDDDWYYEMVAIRAFEKHGPELSVEQLGRQWMENNCGTWGSSEQARLLLAKEGIDVEVFDPRWLLNPGSVGQPRDGDPRGAWIELDTGEWRCTYHRVTYEIDRAAKAIREAGLPELLADRLYVGQ